MLVERPTYLIEGDITDIDLQRLMRDGIKGLILDLDSTLVAPRTGTLTAEVSAWLKRARNDFQLAVVTNNKKDPYIEAIKSILDLPVWGRAGKPSRRCLLQVSESFRLPPAQMAVVGDRPLTDIWAGQRAGMKTILVWPLKSMNEPSWITFVRKLERVLLRP
jgi:HAD superfamily phosphatase (TIGR01668 family)